MALASLQRRPGAPDVGQSPRLVRSRRGFPRGCHCPPLPARLSLTPAAAGGYGACLSGRNGQLRAREGGGGAGACTCVLSCPLRDHEHEEGSRPRRSRGPGWRTCRVPGRAASRVWVGTSSLRPSVSRARERVRQRVSATREKPNPHFIGTQLHPRCRGLDKLVRGRSSSKTSPPVPLAGSREDGGAKTMPRMVMSAEYNIIVRC